MPNFGVVAAHAVFNCHCGRGTKSQHDNSRMGEQEDMHTTSSLHSLTSEPDRMWIDDLSGETTLREIANERKSWPCNRKQRQCRNKTGREFSRIPHVTVDPLRMKNSGPGCWRF